MKKMTTPLTKDSFRLKLHRETLRTLGERELREAAGGATYYCHSGGTHSACSQC
jgi:hypothetical protein